MTARLYFGAVCLSIFGALVVVASPALGQTASDELRAGVQEYQSAKYESAIAHFKAAVALEPGFAKARIYLATAYAERYIPGDDSPENVRIGEQAIEQLKLALQGKTHLEQQRLALRNIASVNFNMKRFDEALDYYKKAIEINPKDADIYFRMAVIDWTQSYARRMELRAMLGLTPTQPLEDKASCAQLRGANQRPVDEGIENSKLVLEFQPDHDDAMAYLNLLYREKADYECDDPAAREADLKAADYWVDETLRVKKIKAEQATP